MRKEVLIKIRSFVLVVIVIASLACLSSLMSENFERTIDMTDYQLKYDHKSDEAKQYVFLDSDNVEVLFIGDYENDRSAKTMIYKDTEYRLRVNADYMYEFHKDGQLLNVYTPIEVRHIDLKESNEEAYLIGEAFRIISIVERKVIYRILFIQFCFVLFAAGMFVDPKYFYQIGYFKRNNKREASKLALFIVRSESVLIALIVVCFPLLRFLV